VGPRDELAERPGILRAFFKRFRETDFPLSMLARQVEGVERGIKMNF